MNETILKISTHKVGDNTYNRLYIGDKNGMKNIVGDKPDLYNTYGGLGIDLTLEDIREIINTLKERVKIMEEYKRVQKIDKLERELESLGYERAFNVGDNIFVKKSDDITIKVVAENGECVRQRPKLLEDNADEIFGRRKR